MTTQKKHFCNLCAELIDGKQVSGYAIVYKNAGTIIELGPLHATDNHICCICLMGLREDDCNPNDKPPFGPPK